MLSVCLNNGNPDEDLKKIYGKPIVNRELQPRKSVSNKQK